AGRKQANPHARPFLRQRPPSSRRSHPPPDPAHRTRPSPGRILKVRTSPSATSALAPAGRKHNLTPVPGRTSGQLSPSALNSFEIRSFFVKFVFLAVPLFGFRPSFGLRISDLGFPVLPIAPILLRA